MKRLILIAASAPTAVSAHAQTYLDNASFAGVDPQSKRIRVPRQECNNGWIREPRRSGGLEYGDAVLGGVARALIGNHGGRSQQVTTLMHENTGSILPVRVAVEPVCGTIVNRPANLGLRSSHTMKTLASSLCALLIVLATPAWADVTRDEAADAAQRVASGRVLSVERAEADRRPVWRVKVLTAQGEVRVILIDAASGRVVG